MDEQDYDIIDQALSTYPQDEAPPSIFPAVMLQVREAQQKARFRLSWLDYALSLFAAGMAGILLILWNSYAPPAPIFVQFHLKTRQVWQQLHLTTGLSAESLAGWMILLAALLGLAVIIAGFRKPFSERQFFQI
mgnify:CR=1 FL=1